MPSISPFGPSATASTSAGTGSEVKTTSVCSATCFGELAQTAPFARNGSAAARLRSCTTSWCPAFCRLAAMPLPIMPSPINPTRIFSSAECKTVVERVLPRDASERKDNRPLRAGEELKALIWPTSILPQPLSSTHPTASARLEMTLWNHYVCRNDRKPVLRAWATPFGLPPFERIRPEHFPPAFDRGMAEHAAEIAASPDPEPPSFANTIEALERSGRLLDRVSRVFHNLDSSDTNDALEAIARDYAPKLAAASDADRARPRPVRADRRRSMPRRAKASGSPPDQRRLLERHHLRLVRSGALLEPRAEGAHGGDLRAPGEPAHPVWPERAA